VKDKTGCKTCRYFTPDGLLARCKWPPHDWSAGMPPWVIDGTQLIYARGNQAIPLAGYRECPQHAARGTP
jgi:hypothetical protein